MSCGVGIEFYRRRKAQEAIAEEARRRVAAAEAEKEAARQAAARTCPCCGTVIYDLRSCQECIEKALACLAVNNPDRALEIAESLRTAWPNDPPLLNAIGTIYEARHDGENALLFYKAAGAADPNFSMPGDNVARLTGRATAASLGMCSRLLPLGQPVLGLVGSGLMFVGVFVPLVKAPVWGTVNYFHNGRGDGVILLVLALVSVILIAAKVYQGLWFTGLGSLALLAFTFVSFQVAMGELADNPFSDWVELQWGWAVLILGALLTTAAAAAPQLRRLLPAWQ
jgi:tetratricopeptide (TPR) repeat protein